MNLGQKVAMNKKRHLKHFYYTSIRYISGFIYTESVTSRWSLTPPSVSLSTFLDSSPSSVTYFIDGPNAQSHSCLANATFLHVLKMLHFYSSTELK